MFGIGQTVALSEAISNGLGEHLGTLSPSQIRNFQQVCYLKRMLCLTANPSSHYTRQNYCILLSYGRRNPLYSC